MTEGNGERRLRNRDGVLDVSFGERPGLEMVTISRGGHEISLDLLKPAQEALLPAEPLGDAAALAGAGQGEEALAFEIGNKAHAFPPKICNANDTLS